MHGDGDGGGEGEAKGVSPSVLLTKIGPRSCHQFENRSRATRARFLQSFAFPHKLS